MEKIKEFFKIINLQIKLMWTIKVIKKKNDTRYKILQNVETRFERKLHLIRKEKDTRYKIIILDSNLVRSEPFKIFKKTKLLVYYSLNIT